MRANSSLSDVQLANGTEPFTTDVVGPILGAG